MLIIREHGIKHRPVWWKQSLLATLAREVQDYVYSSEDFIDKLIPELELNLVWVEVDTSGVRGLAVPNSDCTIWTIVCMVGLCAFQPETVFVVAHELAHMFVGTDTSETNDKEENLCNLTALRILQDIKDGT